MTQRDELNIIAHIRGKVNNHQEPTGENLFLAWGYPTAIFFFVESVALMLLGKNWCEWLWLGIPVVGTPLMIHFLRKDYNRTGHRTLDANIILQMWIYVGFVSVIGGATMGFAGVFEMLYCTFLGPSKIIGLFPPLRQDVFYF